jgi:hypothetical protein
LIALSWQGDRREDRVSSRGGRCPGLVIFIDAPERATELAALIAIAEAA